jgi:hypothetical protein
MNGETRALSTKLWTAISRRINWRPFWLRSRPRRTHTNKKRKWVSIQKTKKTNPPNNFLGEIIHSALEKKEKRDGAIVPHDGCWNARTADPHDDDVKAIRISRRQEKKNNLRQNKNKRRRNITLSSSDLELHAESSSRPWPSDDSEGGQHARLGPTRKLRGCCIVETFPFCFFPGHYILSAAAAVI